MATKMGKKIMDVQDRYEALIERMTKIEATLDVILNNHMAHIEKSIGNIEKRLDKQDNRLWGVILALLTTMIGGVFSFAMWIM